jgi:hypothetical protein
MQEREAIRIRRERGEPKPWTQDPILQNYKFTNVKRDYDRTTQELFRLYAERANLQRPEEVLYNAALYRYFGTSEFAEAVGWLTRHDGKHISRVAHSRMARGDRVFTGAYIVTNCGQVGPKEDVVGTFLENLWAQAEPIVRCIQRTRTWREGYRIMVEVHGFGGKGFYAKEALLDFLHVFPDIVADSATWSPVGPGARRGLNRIYKRDLKFSQSEAMFIGELMDVWTDVNMAWEMTVHDVQWNLCEYDKYMRVKLGEGRPRSRYNGAD